MSDKLVELYPEHAKLLRVQDKFRAVADFIDWCEREGYGISSGGINLTQPENLAYSYLGLYRSKIEEERDFMANRTIIEMMEAAQIAEDRLP